MRRVGDRARVVLVLACACTASEGGAPARAQPDAQPAVVGTSTLPRLQRAWTATNLKTPQWRYRDMSPASDGALIAWGGQGGGELIAIELATGKPRWRTAATAHGPEAQIEFATGMVLVNPPSSGFAALDPAYRPPGETTAFDVKTGKTLWKATLCNFNHHPVDNGTVGFAMCHGAPHVSSSGASGSTMLVAFELVTGRVLWRRPQWPGSNVAISGQLVFMSDGLKLIELDPRTGQEVRKVALPPPSAYQGWSAAGTGAGGKPLALVNGGGDGMRTNRLAALEWPGGRELWSRPYPQGRWKDVRGATAQGGRLFEDGIAEMTEVDVATGKPVLDCPLPRVHEGNNYPRRWRLMRGEVVVMMDAGDRPAVFIRCARDRAPVLAQLPRPAAVSGWQLVAVEDGSVVMRAGDELIAYRIFDTDAPEAVALSPLERIEAILDRVLANRYHTEESIAANRVLYDEIRAVPNHGTHLLALAKQPHPTRRDRAVDAATGLRITGVVELLLAEIFGAPAAPAALTEKQLLAIATSRRHDQASWEYEQLLVRRTAQIVAVAAMDDARAADRLGPLLLARSTPEGLGWWDANVWMGDFGGAWDGATRREQRSHDRHVSTESGYSESLAATFNRPRSHAAIYRSLARLGRPVGLAQLDELHRTTARAGGWVAICNADDAVKARGPERVWVDRWGLCQGIEIGGYRVTQARNILWLRRRLPDGSFGPPAWAADPGGDQCLQHRWMQAAALRGGRIVVRGTNGHDHDAVIGVIDPAGLFADADRDGLTDKTEAAFGTDPKRADTDADGVPDGRDTAPLAGPARGAEGEVTGELMRYAALFLIGGPVMVQGDRAGWSGSANAAGLLLHLPRETAADDQVCKGVWGPERGERDKAPREPRTPFRVARMESLKIDGDRAQTRLVWSRGGSRIAHDLNLARVQGTWRVVDDRNVENYRWSD